LMGCCWAIVGLLLGCCWVFPSHPLSPLTPHRTCVVSGTWQPL
jgi:hypothetical protein